MKKKINIRAIHRPYFFSEIIKKSQTTKSDLEFLANKLGLEVKINWLKDVDPNYKGAQIINLGNPIIGGSHWVATYDGKYFDSFGLVPPEKLDHLEWIPLQIQNQNYGRCGSYAILWLWYAKEGELDQFYNLFNAVH
jgi:hypothetical protein